jgi:hypothetical protein
MDIGVKEETYEYYRAKQNKKNEECLDEEKWSRMKEIEKKRSTKSKWILIMRTWTSNRT